MISIARMDEDEIIVEDVDEHIDKKPAGTSHPRIMPKTLFIPHGKLRPGQTTGHQATVVSPSASQLTAYINPVNNQIVAGQNKLYFQGSSQVSNSQKQRILIHRSLNSVGTTTNNSGQNRILVRQTNTPTAQIVPLNPSQGNQTNAHAGKHSFAYLGTIIKSNKNREPVVISATGDDNRSSVQYIGGITTGQANKQKLVITPVLSQLAPTPTTTTIATQSRLNKHMTNLLLPVNIPQQTSPKTSMMNHVKITNGQVTGDNKGAITVLRESKTTNSTAHPPPLHPITNITLLGKSGRQEHTVDGIKITENPDSAVITPIPNKKDDTNPQPEKRKKTISNILRGSGEKRMKKQIFPKTNPEVEISYSLNSPDSEHEKEKKQQNDDDITLIKVVANEEKTAKLKSTSDDDIKIELVKTAKSAEKPIEKKGESLLKKEESADDLNSIPSDLNFDAAKALEWKDGVGSLPGSSLKFRVNEFGLMEVVDEDEHSKQDKENGAGDKENVFLSQKSSKSTPTVATAEKKKEEKKKRPANADTFYCCQSCGCYGLAAEFESPISCSPSCTEIIEAKKELMKRKEKDLKEMRAKKKRKSLLQEQQKQKQEEKPQAKSTALPPTKLATTSAAKSSSTMTTTKSTSISSIKSSTISSAKSSTKSSTKSSVTESDEDSKDTSNIDEESQTDAYESKYPWLFGKQGFSWAKYLEHCKAKAAPTKLFKDAFPYAKNQFKIGMKLEGIDPEHPSRYCVLSVVEIVGYRLRLHFDGYSESYDFWVNADSMDIFPFGWSEKNNHRLDPPKGYVANNFNWNAYLKICKASAAPKTIFSNKNSIFPTGFRVGMKLEAVDRKHSSLVCVASIGGLMDSRILVHFDSWDEVYDYWADASSPYIHPVGWCHHNGHSLTPPNSYKDAKSFTWDAYLRETQSVAAPARAFKQRPHCGFRRGMKLEAVDKRVPQLIRVASVEDVKDHMLKIRFDGWPENHAYWVDDDSTDIHPVGWCQKTGHPLEAPIIPETGNERPECGTHGCRGIGHIKGPKFISHNSPSGCPYSLHNLPKIRVVSDRLSGKHDLCEYEDEINEKPKVEKTDKIKIEKAEKFEKFTFEDRKPFNFKSKYIKEEVDSDKSEKFDSSQRSGKCRPMNSDGQTDDDEPPKKRKKRRNISEEPVFPRTSLGFGDSQNSSDKQLRMELYHSVYNPGYNPLPDEPHIWAKHSGALNRVVAKQTGNPRRWSNEEVIKFIQSLPNCKEIGTIFRKHNIDGEAFLMLTQEDLMSLLGLRLGPAIKLYNSIVLLRRKAT